MNENTAREYLQTMPDTIIAAVVRGEIDLNQLAAQTLANRGLNLDGQWVGFPAAKLLQASE